MGNIREMWKEEEGCITLLVCYNLILGSLAVFLKCFEVCYLFLLCPSICLSTIGPIVNWCLQGCDVCAHWVDAVIPC
jgi:hypothetical protein